MVIIWCLFNLETVETMTFQLEFSKARTILDCVRGLVVKLGLLKQKQSLDHCLFYEMLMASK